MVTREQPVVALRKLSDSDLTIAEPDADVRGRKVLDRDGEEIGDVDALLVDDREARIRFLLISSGGFLGIGETRFIVPVEAITRVADDAVHVDQSRERVSGAPRYDPTLTRDSDWSASSYWGDVYGYTPYWAPGYMYPPYPRYPY